VKRVVAKSGKEKKAPTDLTHTQKKKPSVVTLPRAHTAARSPLARRARERGGGGGAVEAPVQQAALVYQLLSLGSGLGCTLFLPPPPPLTKPEDSLCYFGIAFCAYCTKS
jgi:hypothetical protein